MADKVEITLAHGLVPRDAQILGIEERDYEPGEVVLVTRDGARSIISSGYATVDPEDKAAVLAALKLTPEPTPEPAPTEDVTPALDPATGPAVDPAVDPADDPADDTSSTGDSEPLDPPVADDENTVSTTRRKR